MYDLKVNYTFITHKRGHNKPTISNVGVQRLACTGKELQCFPVRFRLT